MKILIACQHFDYLSGAPLHVYELARVLKGHGHEVTICSKTGGDLEEKALELGIRIVPEECASVLPGERFDVMSLHQPGVVSRMLSLLPGVPAIQTCHSEWPIEDPVVHPRVRAHIAIRPSIAEKLNAGWGINAHLVWNGVDTGRFNREGLPFRKPEDRKRVLFVGTIDGLRRDAALRLIEKGEREAFDVRFVGRRFSDHLDIHPAHVSVADERWDIEEEVKACDMTAGILLGRTTIEGWACGKPGIVFSIDMEGNAIREELMPPPEYMTPFDAETMAGKYLTVLAAAAAV